MASGVQKQEAMEQVLVGGGGRRNFGFFWVISDRFFLIFFPCCGSDPPPPLPHPPTPAAWRRAGWNAPLWGRVGNEGKPSENRGPPAAARTPITRGNPETPQKNP